jgi:hypothetical protein
MGLSLELAQQFAVVDPSHLEADGCCAVWKTIAKDHSVLPACKTPSGHHAEGAREAVKVE